MKLWLIILIFAAGFLSGAGVIYLVGPSFQNTDVDGVKKRVLGQNLAPNKKVEQIQPIEQTSTAPLKTEIKSKEEGVDTAFYNDSTEVLDTLSSTWGQKDSSELDTLGFDLEDPEIKVKKERLLFAKSYPIVYKEEKQVSKTDSLLAENMGVNKTIRKSIAVEFWQSPLSSKGFQYNNHKVRLYGIDPQLKYTFYMVEGSLYMKTPLEFYRLDPANAFQKFIFADEALILD